ncbi:MAG: 2-oxoglutarate and iron-dependent oxygenase domain-containing protein [Acidimicrobiales bacterium]
MTHAIDVPLIDLSDWFTGDPIARQRIADEVDVAARGLGFMRLVGHGIPASTIDSLTSAMDDFFSQPIEAKLHMVARPEINRGYSPPRSERLSYSLGLASPEDLFEAFNVGASIDDHPGLDLDPVIYATNLWPDVDGFRPGVEEWFEAARSVARTMTSVFALALGLDDAFFDSFTDHSIDVLRMNNYQIPDGIELVEGQLGMGAHSDYGIVTVLWADPVAGLEILPEGRSWCPVQPEEGELLINLGDLLARWTNDRWRSTLHRVVPPRNAAGELIGRRSAAFFHDGNADAIVSTLDPCRFADGSSEYDDVTVAEHLAQKLAGSRGLDLNEHAEREASRVVAADR